MAQGKQFEDLEVWQAARDLVLGIYRLTKDGPLTKDYGFSDQLQRAAVDVMANIAAGHERGGRDLAECLHTAKGAAGKVRSLVHVAKDLGYVSDQRRAELMEQLTVIARQLGGFIRYLEQGPRPAPAGPPGHGPDRAPRP